MLDGKAHCFNDGTGFADYFHTATIRFRLRLAELLVGK